MRGEVQWLRDMVVSCDLIAGYVDGLTYEEFKYDDQRCDAVCYRLAVIGECVGQVADRLRLLLPEMPWAEIKAMRNFVVHDFFSVNRRTLWETTQRDVPRLLTALRTVVRPEE